MQATLFLPLCSPTHHLPAPAAHGGLRLRLHLWKPGGGTRRRSCRIWGVRLPVFGLMQPNVADGGRGCFGGIRLLSRSFQDWDTRV